MNYYKNYDKKLDETDEEEIRNLLLYHKIIKVEGNTLTLDNGTTLTFEGNEGCGGCGSGWYYITELNTCDNVITNVEFAATRTDDPDEYGESGTSYKIFVYAEDRHIKIAQVDGNDGNRYYGTGYTIYVKFKKKETSYYKYGSAEDNFGMKCVNAIEFHNLCIQKYLETGNTEYLYDAANYLMFEFMYLQHPNAHFRATSSEESAGTAGESVGYHKKGAF